MACADALLCDAGVCWGTAADVKSDEPCGDPTVRLDDARHGAGLAEEIAIARSGTCYSSLALLSFTRACCAPSRANGQCCYVKPLTASHSVSSARPLNAAIQKQTQFLPDHPASERRSGRLDAL